ncbi:MAG TPA: flagellar basal body P-ring protein FlgI [Thermodesulfobacteriota bacterium]|nr:flagellar basal body P-ring protein FlgI [Thermodesulfobacteriota bacterium]
MKKRSVLIGLAVITGLMMSLPSFAWGARLKDIAFFKGVRSNQLAGYGLVVGLNGTGDNTTSVDFTIRSIANMLERMGIKIPPDRILVTRLKNVAAVMVTATLPPFGGVGNRIDAHVSSMGDATNLGGGTLLMTPLLGPDRQVYAVGQGAIVTGGFSVSGASGSSITKNHPTAGLISKGAVIEKEVPVTLDGKKELALTLFHPDFTTAEKVKEVINLSMGGAYSRCVDSATIKIAVPDSHQDRVAEWMASLERLEVTPDAVAKVILNEKTGTVVLGEKVRISTVAVAHGNLSIQIKERYNVSQPLPFAPGSPPGTPSIQIPPREGTGPIMTPGGATVVTPESSLAVKEEGKPMIILPSGADLGEVVKALNAIGATPRDLISILQSIKAAGALQADLEVY